MFGRWGAPVATQVLKRLPVNIRPLLGIGKQQNPKAMGLFLKAYCLLHQKTGRQDYLDRAGELCRWLLDHPSRGYSGMGWGYPFPWASSIEYKEAWMPTSVATAVAASGLHDYHTLTGSLEARQALTEAARFVDRHLPATEYPEGISFAYSPISRNATYNASLHAAEILAMAGSASGTRDPRIENAIRFVLSRQKADGSWFYSYDLQKNSERRQIDFHQGFILVSLDNLLRLTGLMEEEISRAIVRGLAFYRNVQFTSEGRSHWRIPKKFPVDIHHQSQGIITFNRLDHYASGEGYAEFAGTIASWTITHMQHPNGFFYYRKYRTGGNHIPFMRWGQAWMMLALSELLKTEKLTKTGTGGTPETHREPHA